MSARDLKESGKILRKKIMYNLFWVYPKKDFEKWKQRFHTTKKNWQMKYLRDGFTWYNHNCIRKKKTCKYSKSADKICEGKMKVAKEADKIGLYRLEFNDDGYEHFISEFNDDTYGNFMSELFEKFDNSVPKPSSSVNEITQFVAGQVERRTAKSIRTDKRILAQVQQFTQVLAGRKPLTEWADGMVAAF